MVRILTKVATLGVSGFSPLFSLYHVAAHCCESTGVFCHPEPFGFQNLVSMLFNALPINLFKNILCDPSFQHEELFQHFAVSCLYLLLNNLCDNVSANEELPLRAIWLANWFDIMVSTLLYVCFCSVVCFTIQLLRTSKFPIDIILVTVDILLDVPEKDKPYHLHMQAHSYHALR